MTEAVFWFGMLMFGGGAAGAGYVIARIVPAEVEDVPVDAPEPKVG